MVYGDSGQYPPSIDCLYNVLCFFNRISFMNCNTLVRKVYEELMILHECGFNTWCSKAFDLMKQYCLASNPNLSDFHLFSLEAAMVMNPSSRKSSFPFLPDSSSENLILIKSMDNLENIDVETFFSSPLTTFPHRSRRLRPLRPS